MNEKMKQVKVVKVKPGVRRGGIESVVAELNHSLWNYIHELKAVSVKNSP